MLIAIERSDGGVSIMRLVGEDRDSGREVERWAALHKGEYVSHREIAEGDVPEDRVFRGAWSFADGKMATDMGRARDIFRGKLRADRQAALTTLDSDYLRADESGDADRKAEIARKKQALRDAPQDPRIEAASTPEELAALKIEVSLASIKAPTRKGA